MAWFTDADLRRLAGSKSYERGAEYVDAVGTVDELPDGVVATVEGTESYVVRLVDRRGVRGECSCPWGKDGNFCKHCVAVGLSLLAATHGRPDVKELRRLVGGLRARGFLSYGRSFEYARKAADVLDALDSVAAALLDAAERAGTLAGTAERADAFLHDRARAGGYAADPLIEILSASGDDDAWSAGLEYRCGPGLMWRLAVDRARTRPADAIPFFARQAENEIDKKTRKGYVEAARLLTELRTLHERAGSDGFPAYLAELRHTHRNKPTLIATLSGADL